MKTISINFLAVILIGLLFTACQKDATTNTASKVSGFVTNTEPKTSAELVEDDDSCAFDDSISAIHLNIVSIKLKYEDQKDSVILLTQPIALNLMDLDTDSVISFIEGFSHPGKLKEIRLVVGDGNFVVRNGVQQDLRIPSGSSSGLKIKIHGNLVAGEEIKFKIDFQIRKSLRKTSDGIYILRPVIKVKILSGDFKCEDTEGDD